MHALPHLVLDTSALPHGERLQAWRSAIPQYEIEPDGPGDDSFDVRSEAWLLGDMVVTFTRNTPATLRRTPKLIGTDGADTYNFSILLSGSWTGEAGEREIVAGPGQLIGLDLSRPFRVATQAAESVVIVVGRSALQDACRAEPDIHGRVLGGAAGLLLADHCLALPRHLPNATSADAAAIVGATLMLLAAALPRSDGATTNGDAPAVRIRRDVRRLVERRLGDAGLDLASIAEVLDLSRPTLYRAFRSVGGVSAFILRRRLHAVRALLLHPRETRPIGDIAHSLGFTNRSHFAAAFRKEFGCSARDLRLTQRTPLDPSRVDGDVSTQFRAWLLRLATL